MYSDSDSQAEKQTPPQNAKEALEEILREKDKLYSITEDVL